MRIDEGNFFRRFAKQLLIFAAIGIPIVLIALVGWWLGEIVAEITSLGWMEDVTGIGLLIVAMAAAQATFVKDR